MKNAIQDGDFITVAAPAAVTSGDGVLVGSLFGVAVNSAASGATVTLATRGVYALTKVGSQAWTVGVKVYWDAANARCTTVSTSNTLIGVATAAVASGAGDTVGNVRLGIVA